MRERKEHQRRDTATHTWSDKYGGKRKTEIKTESNLTAGEMAIWSCDSLSSQTSHSLFLLSISFLARSPSNQPPPPKKNFFTLTTWPGLHSGHVSADCPTSHNASYRLLPAWAPSLGPKPSPELMQPVHWAGGGDWYGDPSP